MSYPPGERRDKAFARLARWEGLLRQHPDAAQVETVSVEEEILAEIVAVLVLAPGSRQHAADWQKWLDLGARTDPPPTTNAKLLEPVSRLRWHRANTSPQPPVVVEADQGRDQDLAAGLPPDNTPGLRPAYRRDHLWLRWQREKRVFGPARIRDRWNAMPEAEQRIVSPRCFGTQVTADVVKEGLRKARSEEQKERRSRTSRKPAGNQRSRKKR